MSRKGELTLQGMIVGMLVFGLFMSMVGWSLVQLGGDYETEGYDEEDLNKYNNMQNLSRTLNQTQGSVEDVAVDRTVFDFFADVWNQITGPFKFIYRSFSLLVSMTGDLVEDLGLPHFFKDFLGAIIITLVIVGIVMIKFYLGRQK